MKLTAVLTLLTVVTCTRTASASPFIRTDDAAKHFPQRIPIGSEAGKGEFPFIVVIRRGGLYCTGSIVNENWIVTAAHCSVAAISGYTVIAGEHVLNLDEGTEQTRTVSQIIRHPSYNSNTLANDVAVWRMSSPFIFNFYVQPANIAPPGFEPAPNLQSVGWWNSNVLMKATIPFVSELDCRISYGTELWPGMLCAGGSLAGGCQGNSGGPLLSGDTLVGIEAWGYGCAIPNYPTVFTDVAYYSNWIRQSTL